jgi:hypothetical protein
LLTVGLHIWPGYYVESLQLISFAIKEMGLLVHITTYCAQHRAFLAQRRGHGGAVERKLLIRAGGLKTCWTKPQGRDRATAMGIATRRGVAMDRKDRRKGQGREN